MLPQTHNYGTYLRGDTVPEKTFTLYWVENGVETAMDLTGATIFIVFRYDSTRRITKTIGSGITAPDLNLGKFTVNSFVPEQAGTYHYDIKITFSDGTVRTYVEGILDIKTDKAR